MNKLALLLVLIPAVIYCLSVEDSFQSWAKLHGRKYHHENEYNYRLGVYKKTFNSLRATTDSILVSLLP